MELEELRQKIDTIDDDLVSLLNQRTTLVVQARHLKRAAGMTFFDPEREQQIINRACKVNAGPLNEASIVVLFRCIISESSATVRRLESCNPD